MINSAAAKKFFSVVTYFVTISFVTSGLGFLFLFNVPVAEAQPNVAEAATWDANGRVWAIKSDGAGTVYLGGEFTTIGRNTGRGVVVSTSADQDLTLLPAVTGGAIEASVPDGSGGWYIGGDFNDVGGTARNGLAHIISDGTLDTSWDPNADNRVLAIAVSGSDIYVGGEFTTVGGQSRNYIAKLNNTNGNADATWDPDADAAVVAIAVSGSTVYAGGEFTTFNAGGVTRNHIVAIPTSSSVPTSWNPDADRTVREIVISGSTVYVGGDFTTFNAGGVTRNYVAAISASSNIPTSWDPNADALVSALTVSGSTIYAGGEFTNIGGQARNYIAALNNTTGAATAWNPNADGFVWTIVVGGSTVYLGGNFTNVGGASRYSLVAIDSSTGNATDWEYSGDSTINVLSFGNLGLFVGGRFNWFGKARNYVAAINESTGRATSWNPQADEKARAFYIDGSTVYLGGDFTNIGGAARNYIAALDATTALATAWDPNADSSIRALTKSGSNIYVGGAFTNIGGQARNRIAAIDAGTGNATAWDPNADNQVWTLLINGSTVYAGGEFTNIGGQARNRIAALDIGTGSATTWNPNANNYVFALDISGSTIYAGGQFTNIGGQARNRLAAIDSSGNATAWNPNVAGFLATVAVRSVVIKSSLVYIGGFFGTVGGQPRAYAAAVDISTGSPTSWRPFLVYSAGTDVFVLETGSPVYLGGVGFGTGGTSKFYFAQFGSSPKMKDTLTRLKVNTDANHTIEITLGTSIDWDANDTLTLTFESDFDLTALSSADPLDYDINTGVEETIVANGGCGASDAIEITSIAGQVITFTACSSYTPPGTNATIIIEIGTNATTGGAGDSQITNPTVAGTYDVDFAGTIGDSNSCSVAIVDDDTVTITATVDPVFTFVISSPSCALGTLLTSTISTCSYYLAVGTNATGGAVITIQDIDDGDGTTGLDLDSNPATALANVLEDGTVGPAGTEEYGIAVTAGTAWYEQGDFTDDDTPIPTSLTALVNTPGPVDDTVANRTTITHRASISATSPAGTYAQAVQYIATGTF